MGEFKQYMCVLNVLYSPPTFLQAVQFQLKSTAYYSDPDHVSGLMKDMEEVKKEEPHDEDNEVSESIVHTMTLQHI